MAKLNRKKQKNHSVTKKFEKGLTPGDMCTCEILFHPAYLNINEKGDYCQKWVSRN